MAQSDYRLGPFDQLRVRIVTWRPQAEIFEWSVINGEYTIDADGKISLPLIGEVRAADATTGELSDQIARRLQERTSIAEKPDASVGIIKYRPFYIVGDVAKSGEYSYRPGMTVIQAMSVAGGLPRSHAIDVRQVEREVTGWTGELQELADERTLLRAELEQQEKMYALEQQDRQKVDDPHKAGIVTDTRYMEAQRDATVAESEVFRLKSKLSSIDHKIATNKLLISQSGKIAPIWAGAQLSFSILRHDGATFKEFPATETTLVAPGDTIKVKCCGGSSVDSESSASGQAQSLRSEGAPSR